MSMAEIQEYMNGLHDNEYMLRNILLAWKVSFWVDICMGGEVTD